MKFKFYFFCSILLFVACQNNTQADKQIITNNDEKDVILSPFDSVNAIINTDPYNIDALIKRAQIYISQGNAKFAQADILDAYKIDSTNSKVLFVLGQVKFAQNKTRESKDNWTKCMELDPENMDCRLALAELYLAVTDYESALNLLNEATEIDNNNAKAYYMKGIVVRDLRQDTNTALQYFQRAVDLKQDYIEALDMIAVTLANRKDTFALFYYDRLLELKPNDALTYYKLGVFHMSMGNPNEALEAYTKAIQLNPNDANSLFNLGFMMIELDQVREARKYFMQAAQVQERNYKAYYGVGYTYEIVGDLDRATENYRKSLEILSMYTPAIQGMQRINNILQESQQLNQDNQ